MLLSSPRGTVSRLLSVFLLATVLTACSAPANAPATVAILPEATTTTTNPSLAVTRATRPSAASAAVTSSPADTATITDLPTATVTPQATPDQRTISRLRDFLAKISFNGSVLVAQDGQVLLSQGYGQADRKMMLPNTDKTKFRLASVTKQFTAMAILILQSQGKLDLQDPVCSYIPDCPASWKEITIHHLLTHTSGLPNYMNFSDWGRFHAQPASPSELLARFRDKPLDFQPGKKWSYSNSGYVVLGSIIEQVSGDPFENFIQKNIFDPLQMANSGYLDITGDVAVGYADPTAASPAKIDAVSELYAAGGLYSTVGDLYLWDQALSSDKLVPEYLRERMFTPYMQVPYPDGFGYGYGWMIGKTASHRVLSHAGHIEGYSSINNYFPDDQVEVVVLGNQDNESVETIAGQLAKIVFAAK